MKSHDEMVTCQTPSPGKLPTRIKKWKYDLVHNSVLKVVRSQDNGVEFRKLPQLVKDTLNTKELQQLGSVPWYTTTVKLDMEVRGEIKRIPGSNPQRLIAL